jgi:FtsH-binding integral membrane protein
MNTSVYRTASELNNSMIRVYNNMFLAVLNSLIVSYFVSTSGTMMSLLFDTPLKWLIIFAPLVLVLLFSTMMNTVSKSTAQIMLHVFAAVMGLSLSTVFAVYTSASIVTAFLGASVLFGTMSLWGYFTKQNLESWGQFLMIGVIAVIIAAVINLFIGSTALQMTISSIAIIVFTALTAYDSQQIRESLELKNDGNTEVTDALRLYMNFINIFISLLQLFGDRK